MVPWSLPVRLHGGVTAHGALLRLDGLPQHLVALRELLRLGARDRSRVRGRHCCSVLTLAARRHSASHRLLLPLLLLRHECDGVGVLLLLHRPLLRQLLLLVLHLQLH